MKNKKLKIKTSSFWTLILLLTTYCLLLSTHCLYASNEGTATATFLRLEQGARALGMGGAFVAIADNSDGIYYNPAGIAQIKKKEVSFTYSSLYQDIASSFLSLALPTAKSGTFGMGLTYLTVGGIEAADSAGNMLGEISVYNMAATCAYAAKTDGLCLGVGAKFIQQDYDVESGAGFAVDTGFIIELAKDMLSLGASALNIGPKAKIGDVKNKLPMNYRAGVGCKPIDNLTLAADIEKPIDADNKLHAGAEYDYNSLLSVRVGYQTIKDMGKGAGLTAGAGIKSNMRKGKKEFLRRRNEPIPERELMVFYFDYAYVACGDFDATHRITVGLKF